MKEIKPYLWPLLFNAFIATCLIYLSYDIVFNFEEYLNPIESMTSKQNGYILLVLILHSASPVLVYLLAFFQVCIAFLPLNVVFKTIVKIIKAWS